MQIDFPYQFDRQNRTARTTDEDNVSDMIEQLLFTNPGERVNRPDFGSGLLQLVFAPNSPELAAALRFTTQAALQQHLGGVIEVQELDVAAEDAVLSVRLTYALRATGETRTVTLTRGGTP